MIADEMERACQLMAKYRVSRLKTGDMELEMSPLGFSMPEAEAEARPTQPIGTENGGYPTEDELLLWSAGPQPSINAEAPKEP